MEVAFNVSQLNETAGYVWYVWYVKSVTNSYKLESQSTPQFHLPLENMAKLSFRTTHSSTRSLPTQAPAILNYTHQIIVATTTTTLSKTQTSVFPTIIGINNLYQEGTVRK